MLKQETIALLRREDDLLEKMIIISHELFEDKKCVGGGSYLEGLYTIIAVQENYEDKIVYLASRLILHNKISYGELKAFGFTEQLLDKVKENSTIHIQFEEKPQKPVKQYVKRRDENDRY